MHRAKLPISRYLSKNLLKPLVELADEVVARLEMAGPADADRLPEPLKREDPLLQGLPQGPYVLFTVKIRVRSELTPLLVGLLRMGYLNPIYNLLALIFGASCHWRAS